MGVNFAIGSDNYRLDVFPLATFEGSNGSPVDVALTSTHAWVSCEFDRRIYSVPLSAVDGDVPTPVEIPAPAGAFRSTLFGPSLPSDLASCEDIDSDAAGNLWLTQAGQFNQATGHDNLSRLLRYTPATGEWASYPLPYNNGDAVALCVDGPRVWTTSANPQHGAAVCVTRPASWHDPDPLIPQGEQGSERNAWRVIEYARAFPAHAAVIGGNLWIADYWGNSISKLDRTTFAVTTYALPTAPAGTTVPGTRGPWNLAGDLMGNIWVTLDYSREVGVLNPSTGVWTLNALPISAPEGVHGIAMGPDGQPWVTVYSTGGGGRFARRTVAGAWQVSPGLDTLGLTKGATGGVWDASGRFWCGLYGARAIGRVTKL
jgi:streptogramin lyase